ncbi:MAG: hypothetical protein WAL98_19345 [Desulfatiglandaceae bacterium]
MAKDCCWNCKYYVVKGDNEPALLRSAESNVCTFSDQRPDMGQEKSADKNWTHNVSATPPHYVCRNYRERFY